MSNPTQAKRNLPPLPSKTSATATRIPIYRETNDGLVWLKPVKHGSVPTLLTNFVARIVAEIQENDGAEIHRFFEIEVQLNGRVERVRVSSDRFSVMSWVTEQLGAEAIVSAGIVTKDHARAAIQSVSGRIPKHTVFTHTGWHQVGNDWVYLHGRGAIGRDGAVPGIDVHFPDPLSGYQLPDFDGKDLKESVQASLRLLKVAKLSMTVPILGAIYRAVLGRADFSVYVSGRSGAAKSELAALAQQHFGALMDAEHLPTGWSSTSNALEGIAFSAKDALLVVDDFVPQGSIGDVQRSHREADRLFRAQGNNSGRQRMRADGSLRPARPPRGLLLSTGEDIPRGQSLRARMFVVELSPDAMNWDRLAECQRDAAAGLYAQAMAGFLRWVAQHHGKLQAYRQRKVLRLRGMVSIAGGHRRTPEIVANLWVGIFLFLFFATTVNAITPGEARRLASKSLKILRRAVGVQAKYHAANDPARRFLELIGAAISSGRGHVADVQGNAPPNPTAWGWRDRSGSYGSWEPQGHLVGWISGDDLYLEPDGAYSTAQRMAREIGESITVSSQTVRKRLHEGGLLVCVERSRETFMVRRTLGGAQRRVLHLKATALGISPVQESDEDDDT